MLGTFGIQVNKKAKIQLLFFERELWKQRCLNELRFVYESVILWILYSNSSKASRPLVVELEQQLALQWDNFFLTIIKKIFLVLLWRYHALPCGTKKSKSFSYLITFWFQFYQGNWDQIPTHHKILRFVNHKPNISNSTSKALLNVLPRFAELGSARYISSATLAL